MEKKIEAEAPILTEEDFALEYEHLTRTCEPRVPSTFVSWNANGLQKRMEDVYDWAERLPDAKKVDVPVDQLDFEFVLFASAVIDYDYIMGLIAKYSQKAPGKATMTREELIGLISADAKFMMERDAITAYINTLKAGEGLSEAAIREGYTRFKAEQSARELAAIATKHGLATATLQAFVDAILSRMIFDGEQLSELLAPLELGGAMDVLPFVVPGWLLLAIGAMLDLAGGDRHAPAAAEGPAPDLEQGRCLAPLELGPAQQLHHPFGQLRWGAAGDQLLRTGQLLDVGLQDRVEHGVVGQGIAIELVGAQLGAGGFIADLPPHQLAFAWQPQLTPAGAGGG
jgi:hypothetical protein